ncbi:MAG: glycosyltransferase family 4 protein [Candidatus Woesearchaeota archaeon]
MKILFISRRFYPDIKGGGQISAFYLAKTLKEKGHEIIVCTFHEQETIKEIIDGITIYRIKISTLKILSKISNLDYMYIQMAKLSSKIIQETNPDIIHLLNFESIPLSSIYYKKKFKKPIFATVNGPNFGCFTQNAIDYKNNTCLNCKASKRFLCSIHKWKLNGVFYYIYSLYYMNMLRLSYRYVDRFLIISNAMKPLLINMGIDEKRIILVNNLLGKKLNVDKKELEKIKKNHKGKIIFCAGRLTENKGIQYIIRAMEYIKATLLIAGWGDYENELKKIAEKVKNKIVFLGKINYENLGTYYKACDIFAHFPTYYEPFGRTLIEAMSFGKPVVAYPIAGIKDIVINKYNGLLVESREPKIIAENINKLLKDKNLYKKFSINAKKTVDEKFSNEIIANNYINAYKTILK